MIDTVFYDRLNNWRRVYGDKPTRCISPTYVFCRYAQAYFDRLPETEEERYWRELSESSNREKTMPAPDYEDAKHLNDIWCSLPDKINGLPVKKVVKLFVFGRNWEYERLCRKLRISSGEERHWREKIFRIFADCLNENT